MNPALYKTLEAHYRRRRTTLLIIAGLCIVVMLLAIGWGVAHLVDNPPAGRCTPRTRTYASCVDAYYNGITSKMAFWSIAPFLALVFTGFGLWPLREIDQAPLIRVFSSRREEVAWIYPKRTSVRRYGVEVNQIHEVVVGLTNRKRVTLAMPKEGDVQEAVRLMAAEAPRAARGYSAETEQRYLTDPVAVLSSAATPPPVRGVPSGPAVPVRMVVAPECPFERIDTGLRYLGLTPEGSAPAPGEPPTATWTGRGARVEYTFAPSVHLRVLDFSGVEPERLRHELGGVVGVPAVASPQVLGMLAAPDPRWALFGVLAAEALGVGEERRVYRDTIVQLASHPAPQVAQAARRVSQAWA